jgi:Arc/MetJ-type ribon-helix-helix transcriptional regulator|nr:ribbon-helix-helix domain-containing protein [Neorhizobium tomejilense]
MGRHKTNFDQTPARLPEGTLDRIDAVLKPGEYRSDFLRKAVEQELDRRERCRETGTS